MSDRVLDESVGDGCRGQRQQEQAGILNGAKVVAQVLGRDDEERPMP